MIYIVRINDKQYEVEVERGKANLLKTSAITQPEIAPAAPQALPASAPQPSTVARPPADANAISTPIPGTILDIKVSAGQSVKKGDVLLVLEAMKMENEIPAPHDGVVSQVFVTKGASVATGDALISLQ